jgi:hypothetical protein
MQAVRLSVDTNPALQGRQFKEELPATAAMVLLGHKVQAADSGAAKCPGGHGTHVVRGKLFSLR